MKPIKSMIRFSFQTRVKIFKIDLDSLSLKYTTRYYNNIENIELENIYICQSGNASLDADESVIQAKLLLDRLGLEFYPK